MLAEVNWLEFYQTEQCEEKLEFFQNVVLSGLFCFLPKRTVELHINDKPWITSKYKDLIIKRQRAFHKGDRALYRKLRNRITREGNELKTNFLNSKLEELRTGKNNKKLRGIVKQ